MRSRLLSIFFLTFLTSNLFAQPTPSPSALVFPNTAPGEDPNIATVRIPNAPIDANLWRGQGDPTVNTTGTGNWLRVGYASGDNSALQVLVIPGLLQPGSYSASVSWRVGRASGEATLVIPVRLTVSADVPPLLTASPYSLVFESNSVATQNITLTCSQPSSYTSFVASANRWISAPARSTGSAAQFTVPITVIPQFNPAAGEITFGMCGTTVDVSVRFIPPVRQTIFLSQTNVRFPNAEPGTSPNRVNLTVTSVNPSISTFRARKLSNTGSWLTVETSEGPTPGTLTLSADPSGLPAGFYHGMVAVSGPTGTSATVMVTLQVATELSTSPAGLTFTQSSGYAPQEVQIFSPHTATLTATVTSGERWLSVTPVRSGPTMAATLLVSVKPDLLGVGVNIGNIRVDAGDKSTGIGVSAFPPEYFPTSLVFTANTNGVPSSQSLYALGASAAEARYSDTPPAPWLSARIGEGPDTAMVVITANPTGLPAGVYQGYVAVSFPGLDPRYYPVTFTVGPTSTGALSATPSSLNFVYITGQLVGPSQFVTVSNGGAPYFLTTSTAWLSASPAEVTTAPGFVTRVDPTALTPGLYTGQLTVNMPPSSVLIPVTLTVTAGSSGAVTATPGNVDFLYSSDQPPPADQTITIRTQAPSAFTVTLPDKAAQVVSAHPLSGYTTSSGSGGEATATVRVGVNRVSVTGAGNVSESLLISTPIGTARVGVNALLSDPLPTTGLRYVSITPCRLVETRAAYNFEGRTGAFGPPSIGGSGTRTIDLAAAKVCTLPLDAKALLVNVTVIPTSAAPVAITLWPGNRYKPQPDYTTVVSNDSLIVANSAIVTLSPTRTFNLSSTSPTDLIIDVTGYFTNNPQLNGLAFYPVTPCRAVDTRVVYRPQGGAFGPPSLQAQTTRRFAIPQSPYCTGLTGARAYVATLTAVPSGPLQFITLWPSGSAQPNVSSINSPAGRTLANSVVLPAGPDGSIDVYAYNNADLLIDITGYFAPDDGQNGLFYFPLPQCQLDSNYYAANSSHPIPVNGSTSCPGVPITARAAAINAVVPASVTPMPFLTAWASGKPRPNTSFLNAFEGQAVANAVIVPMNEGSFDLYAYLATNVTVGLSGYFAR